MESPILDTSKHKFDKNARTQAVKKSSGLPPQQEVFLFRVLSVGALLLILGAITLLILHFTHV